MQSAFQNHPRQTQSTTTALPSTSTNMFIQYVALKRAIFASVLMVACPITIYVMQANAVFEKEEEEEEGLNNENVVQQEETVVEDNLPPVAMYPNTGDSTNNLFNSCTNMDRFENSKVIRRSYEVHHPQHDNHGQG